MRRVSAAAGETKVLYGLQHVRFREWRFIPPSEPSDAPGAKKGSVLEQESPPFLGVLLSFNTWCAARASGYWVWWWGAEGGVEA